MCSAERRYFSFVGLWHSAAACVAPSVPVAFFVTALHINQQCDQYYRLIQFHNLFTYHTVPYAPVPTCLRSRYRSGTSHEVLLTSCR